MTRRKHGKYDLIALALQGGGALGSYYLGLYKALEEEGYLPDFVSGISIGGFTAAIIAGNHPQDRMKKLEDFWRAISWEKALPKQFIQPFMSGLDPYQVEFLRKAETKFNANRSLLFGQPNFFEPRWLPPSLHPDKTDGAVSYYDTSKLRVILQDFINFDIINEGKTRLSLGAVRVKDTQVTFFDSANEPITIDHVMACGALPPAFPGVRIKGDLYWDGACVGNTPIEAIYFARIHENTLVFMADLFSLEGSEPRTMEDVKTRMKDMRYAHRSLHHTETIKDRLNYKKALQQFWVHLPEELKKDPVIQKLKDRAISYSFDIVNVVYDAAPFENYTKDYDFSLQSLKERKQQGYDDMIQVFKDRAWHQEQGAENGSTVYQYKPHKRK